MQLCKWSCVVLLVGSVACEDGYKPPAYVFGTLGYACAADTDAACDGMVPAPGPDPQGLSLLPALARGTAFSITTPIDGAVASLTPNRLMPLASGFVAAELGLGAMTDGVSYDHVDVREPADVQIAHESVADSRLFDEVFGTADFPIRLPTDRFRATLVDVRGDLLAGGAACTWNSDNPQVIQVVSSPASHIVTFEVVGEGTATLTVKMAGVSNQVPFNITFN